MKKAIIETMKAIMIRVRTGFIGIWEKTINFFKRNILYPISLLILFICSKKQIYKQFVALLMGILIEVLVAIISYNDYFQMYNLSLSQLGDAWLLIGTMIGGMIAVVFSLSLFTLQRAAELYSPWFMKLFVYDWREKTAFLSITFIDIAFFISGFAAKADNKFLNDYRTTAFYETLLLIILVLLLIPWHYQNVINKADPEQAIKKIYELSRKYFKKARRQINIAYTIAKLKKTNVNKKLIEENFYELNQERLNLYIQGIVDITYRLSDRRQIEATNSGLNAIYKILINYLEERRGSIFLIPSDDYFLANDTNINHFFALVLEKITLLGQSFIKEQKIINSRHTLNILTDLAVYVSKLKLQNIGFKENPLFNLIHGCMMGDLIMIAINHNEKETVYKAVKNIGILADAAIEQELFICLSQIEDDILEISINHISDERSYVLHECQKINCNILRGLLFKNSNAQKDIVSRTAIKECLGKIIRMVEIINQGIGKGFLSQMKNHETFNMPFYEITKIVNDLVSHATQQEKESNRNQIYSTILFLVDETYFQLRELSRDINIFDSNIGSGIAYLLNNLIGILDDMIAVTGNNSLKADITHSIINVINIPTIILGSAKSQKLFGSFWQITDNILLGALKLYKRTKEHKYLTLGINSLYAIAYDLIEKDFIDAFNEAPRTMLKLIKIGVVANKNSESQILQEASKCIKEFEKKYEEKYLKDAPDSFKKENTLERQTYRWRYDFNRNNNGYVPLLLDPDLLLEKTIDMNDIDRFIALVWNTIPGDSEIEAELKLQIEKAYKRKNCKK